MSNALAENFNPGWKRASAGVGFGDALVENEDEVLGEQAFGPSKRFWKI